MSFSGRLAGFSFGTSGSFNRTKNMKTLEKQTVLLTAQTFAQKLANISTMLAELAHEYAQALDVRPELRAELIEAGHPAELIDRIERFGRGQIHERIVLNSARWARRVMLLPLSAQTDLIENGVEVLDVNETDHRMIQLDSLSAKQVQQVFTANGSVRTLAEQRTYLREQRAKQPVIDVSLVTFEKDGIHAGGVLVTPEMMAQWFARSGRK